MKNTFTDTGYIMQIQNFSVNDGAGIRTNIFLAGCPMSCAWCSNPEGQTMENPMTRRSTVREILEMIKKQMIFYRYSGGGVTFTGGEATMQREFLRILVNECYDLGIDLALETCGAFRFEEIRDILEKFHLIFMDMKHMDPVMHEKYTGYELQPILENIRKVGKLQEENEKELVIRIPVIQNVNAGMENIQATLNFIKEALKEPMIEFLPYHTYGETKYKELKKKLPSAVFAVPTEEKMEAYKRLACDMGVKVVSFR